MELDCHQHCYIKVSLMKIDGLQKMMGKTHKVFIFHKFENEFPYDIILNDFICLYSYFDIYYFIPVFIMLHKMKSVSSLFCYFTAWFVFLSATSQILFSTFHQMYFTCICFITCLQIQSSSLRWPVEGLYAQIFSWIDTQCVSAIQNPTWIKKWGDDM